MTEINARDYVGAIHCLRGADGHAGLGSPPDQGSALAGALLAKPDVDWSDLTIDLKNCAPGLLICAFFSGFLQRIEEERPDLLNDVKKVKWLTAFDFQHESIDLWMKTYRMESERVDELATRNERVETSSPKAEAVNHPSHYGGDHNPYEVIKVIEAWRLNFNLGNTVKYIGRHPYKGSALEDLKKARWYLDREIQILETMKGE